MIQINQKIPDFSFDVFDNNKIEKTKLSEYKNKWLVLLFYPADFTFVCPTELEDAAENYPNFQKEGAEIISFSTDTVYVHKAWHNESPAIAKVKYLMGADPTGNICRAFGTYIDKEGLSLRATFIIDPKQILKSAELIDNAVGRNIDETLRKLQAIKYVYENPSFVCPAKWQPGAKTLKPSTQLVGKI